MLPSSILFVLWKDKAKVTIMRRTDEGIVATTLSKFWFIYLSNTTTVDPSEAPAKVMHRYSIRDDSKIQTWTTKSIERYEYKKHVQWVYDKIGSRDFIYKWLASPKLRNKIYLESILFLHKSGINPLKIAYASKRGGPSSHFKGAQIISSSFSTESRRFIIRKAMYLKGSTMTIMIDNREIFLIKDIVGLWTYDPREFLVENQAFKDAIGAYDIEHIVSNSYGSDNDDPRNGCLLDWRLNRYKGSTMLFLVDDIYIDRVHALKKRQKEYLRSLKPWYKRLFS